MFCSSCGQQNRGDARFCDKCGQALPLERMPTTVQLVQPSSSTPAPLQQAPSQIDTGPGGIGWQADLSPLQQQESFDNNMGPSGLGWQLPATIDQAPPTPLPQRTTSSPPTTPAPTQLRGHDGIVGIVRNVQQSQSRQTTQVLRFRLELYDRYGNRTVVKSVEMRSLDIVGFISDGDQVEVFGKSKGGLILAKQIANLTTGAIVEAQGYPACSKVFFVLVCIFIAAIFCTIIAVFVIGAVLGLSH